MMKKLFCLTMILLSILVVFNPGYAASRRPQEQQAASLTVRIDSATVAAGATTKLKITADIPNGMNLAGIKLDIVYNPAVITPILCTLGPDFTGACNLAFASNTIRLNIITGTAKTGTGVILGELSISAIGTSGSSDLILTVQKALDDKVNPISGVVPVNGKISISGTPVTGTPTITPTTVTPTITPTTGTPSVTPTTGTPTITPTTAPTMYSISGKVVDNMSIPVSGITISGGGAGTTTTNASGDYTLSVPAGTYTLTPSTSLIGVAFKPSVLVVTVPPSAVNQNFTMGPITGCTDIIKNGNFESNTDWYLPITKFPAGMKSPTINDVELMEAATAAYSSDEVHSGSRSLRTGIINPAMNIYSYSSGWQQVTIPASISKAELNFWAFPSSMNGIDGIDVQLNLILNTNKQEISRPVNMRSDERIWKQFAVDLLPLAGQTVWIYFGTYNNGWGANMSMYIDDVTLEVCP